MKKTKLLFGILIITLGPLLEIQAQYPFTNGLVAYYPLNGNANDASGFGNNGTAYGPLTYVDHSSLGFAGEFVPMATKYVEIPHGPQLVLSNAFSVHFWYKPNSVGNAGRILQKHYPVIHGPGSTWEILHYDDNKIRFTYAWPGSPDDFETVCPIPVAVGAWQSCGYTFSTADNTFRAYLNGVLVTNQVPVHGVLPFDTTLSLLLMHDRRDSLDAEGWLDEVRIYNRALSSSEVQQLYDYESGPRVGLIKAVKPSFSTLTPGVKYQLQASLDLNTWYDQGLPFFATSTNMVYPSYYDVDSWDQLFFRLQVVP